MSGSGSYRMSEIYVNCKMKRGMVGDGGASQTGFRASRSRGTVIYFLRSPA
jgi:hypothetical protein